MILGFLVLSVNLFAQVSVFDETVVEKENWEPAIPRPEQEKVASQKLKDFEKNAGQKLNVLIFFVDDLGWGDPGCFGGGAAIGAPTPNIDHLAFEGKKFTSFYSTPTCTPSRAALMTGRLPVRSGLTRPLLKGDEVKTNPWSIEVTQAKLLSSIGYNTALIGKWHIGEGENMLPHEVGFDYFYGLPAATADYSQYLDTRTYSDMLNNPVLREKAQELRTEGLLTGVKGGKREVCFPMQVFIHGEAVKVLLGKEECVCRV